MHRSTTHTLRGTRNELWNSSTSRTIVVRFILMRLRRRRFCASRIEYCSAIQMVDHEVVREGKTMSFKRGCRDAAME
jgi:hypothetical protein